MQIIEEHIVSKQSSPTRLQDYAVNIFSTAATKSALKKTIKKGLIFINNQPANTGDWLHGGEIIQLLKTNETSKHKNFHLDLKILYEDDYLAAIAKPAGVLVSGNSFATIANTLSKNLEPSSQKDAVTPQPVHRLDYPTSGILLIGKTSASILQLNKLFEHKKIEKTYLAITIGVMNSSGILNNPINNKKAETHYQVLTSIDSSRFKQLNLVKLSPKTGRKHQLRIHLSAFGHQILGDKDYGVEELKLKGKGLYLHAYQLAFTHPFTQQKIRIQHPPTKKFYSIFPQLNQLIL